MGTRKKRLNQDRRAIQWHEMVANVEHGCFNAVEWCTFTVVRLMEEVRGGNVMQWAEISRLV